MDFVVARVCRAGLFGRPKKKPERCETFSSWVKSGDFTNNRFHYIMLRQTFIKHTVDDNGVHVLNYWGPMTKNRVMKIVRSIPTDPVTGLTYLSRAV